MCGIAGYLRLDGAPSDPERLREMGARLAHRGPDGSGIWRDGALGFSHRRLSIIDLATGDQPMVRADLGRALVFNGEIYNYLELREELLALGQTFTTASDTEVLLVGHAQWGEQLFPKLRGMFAFALWETGPKRLTVVRDPVGKKPLQLAHLPGRLFGFASEAKALFALPEISRAIEPQAIAAYLDFMYVPEQLSLFRDLERLQAGEYAVLEAGKLRRTFYAADSALNLARQGQPPAADLSFDEACARVDRAVREATRIRLRSDVPLGLFLSGGIDSSLIALEAAALSPQRLRTFTVGFHAPQDERPWARQVAEAIGSDHTELMVTLDAPALAAEILGQFDEPFGDSSAVPQLAIARETRREVKVVLSGDGGDEIFGGYGSYLRHLRANVAQSAPGAARRTVARFASAMRERARQLPTPLAAMLALAARPFRSRLDAVADAEEREPALRQLLSMRVSHSARPEAMLATWLGGAAIPLARIVERAPHGVPALRAAMHTDRLVYLPGDILKKVDICSMRVGLEVRSPLLDDDVIALADALPLGFLVERQAGKAEEHFGKRLLKKLVEDRLGAGFAYRPKQGFGAPLQEWLDEPRFVELAQDGFASSSSPLRPWFEPGARERVLREFRAGKRWLAQELWNLIALDAWARNARPT